MYRSAARDAGVGLIEVVIAVVVLGVGVVGVLGGYATLIRTSASHSEQSKVTSALTIAAEAIARGDMDYQADCAAAATYDPAIATALSEAGSEAAVRVVSIEYWDGAAFVATCLDGDVSSRLRIQRIQLEGEYRRVSDTLTVVKRDDS